MFSIIIPLYNKAPYIKKAIQSVLNQTFRKFEIIIINDGSMDNSLEVVRNIDFSGIDITIINQPNSGVSTARNNGVKRAKYGYIAFLDADDWWNERFLEEMKSLIEEYPNAALYAGSYFKVKNKQCIPAKIGIPENFKKGYFDYCQAYAFSPWMPVWTGAVILKKEAFFKINGFNPKLKLGEDFDLWLRTALKYKVALLNKPLAYYNQQVELSSRAVGKLYQPEDHILWNLDEFEKQSATIPYLKQMLDNLRVYGLLPYYLNDKYRQSALHELAKVDWRKQPESEYKKYYRTPVWYLKIKYRLLKTSSIIKQFCLRIIR